MLNYSLESRQGLPPLGQMILSFFAADLQSNPAKTGAYLQMRKGESSAAILTALRIGPIMPLTGPEVGANGWRPHLHSISLIEQQA